MIDLHRQLAELDRLIVLGTGIQQFTYPSPEPKARVETKLPAVLVERIAKAGRVER